MTKKHVTLLTLTDLLLLESSAASFEHDMPLGEASFERLTKLRLVGMINIGDGRRGQLHRSGFVPAGCDVLLNQFVTGNLTRLGRMIIDGKMLVQLKSHAHSGLQRSHAIDQIVRLRAKGVLISRKLPPNL